MLEGLQSSHLKEKFGSTLRAKLLCFPQPIHSIKVNACRQSDSKGDVSVGASGGRCFNASTDLFDLRDVWLGCVGIYYKKNKTALSLSYECRQGSIAGAPDSSEATASVTFELSKALRLQGCSYKGFSDGSPDLGGGMQVSVRY